MNKVRLVTEFLGSALGTSQREKLWLIQCTGSGDAADAQQIKVRETNKQPLMSRTDPATNNYSIQNISEGAIKKL